MSNPVTAFPNTICDQCEYLITESDYVFLLDGLKYCVDCASENGNICDCGQFKKEEFKQCYDCSKS